jgi:hypothetical protein
LVWGWGGCGAWAQAATPGLRRIGYPQHDAGRVPQWRYLVEVLELAIRASGVPYELAELQTPMVQGRAIRALADGYPGLDLIWTMTDREREAQLLPIRIPLDRGLIGHRLLLVRADQAERWRELTQLSELAQAVAGQGHDWPDAEILRANGLKVAVTSRYEALFEMLRLRRIDYFPRSVIEIDDELASPLAQGLVIEPHLLLRYPAAAYLFVRQGRADLAADLQRGLDAAIADGSFQRLFQRHFGSLIERHRLAHRLLLPLRNPLLPTATPLDRTGLWLQLG